MLAGEAGWAVHSDQAHVVCQATQITQDPALIFVMMAVVWVAVVIALQGALQAMQEHLAADDGCGSAQGPHSQFAAVSLEQATEAAALLVR